MKGGDIKKETAITTSTNAMTSGSSASKVNSQQTTAVKSDQPVNGGTPFASTLEKILISGQDETTAAGSVELSLGLLMPANNPLWTEAPKPEMEIESLEEMADTLITALISNASEKEQQLILANPQLVKWIIQAKEVFSAPGSLNGTKSESNAAPTFSGLEGSNQIAQKSEVVQSIILQLITALKQEPGNPSLANLADSFQETLKPLIALLENNNLVLTQTHGSAAMKVIDPTIALLEQSSILSPLKAGKKAEAEAATMNNAVTDLLGKMKDSSKNQGIQGISYAVKPEISLLFRNHLPHMNLAENMISAVQASTLSGSTDGSAALEAQKAIPLANANPLSSNTPQPVNMLQLVRDLKMNAETDNTVPMPAPTQETSRMAQLEQLSKAAPQQMNAHNFTEEMSQFIMKGLKMTSVDGFSEARITLIPENLGKVDVRITMHNGQMVAQFMTESLFGKEILDSQMSQLRAALSSQGIQVDKLEVTQNNPLQTNLFQGQKQHSSQQFNRQDKNKGLDYDQAGNNFALELENSSRPEKWMYGNTFNATA
ncbi:MAG TPA: flagellar hook-length control protein FliK [Bacilli bacterium]